jgi:hypothetical protein
MQEGNNQQEFDNSTATTSFGHLDKKNLPCRILELMNEIVLFFEFSTLKLSYLEAMIRKLHGKFCETCY